MLPPLWLAIPSRGADPPWEPWQPGDPCEEMNDVSISWEEQHRLQVGFYPLAPSWITWSRE